MKINLLTKIFIGLILGVIVGIVMGPNAAVFKPLGDLFLRLIRMIIVPLILASLVVGTASTGDLRRLGSMGGKTVGYYLGTTVIAVSIGLLFGNIFKPGSGLQMDIGGLTMEAREAPGLIQTLLNIIPTNPFGALTDGNVLQIIFFAIALGIGITVVGSKSQPVFKFFEGFAEVMYKITGFVMQVAPFGVFGLIATTVGNYGLEVIMPLIKLILVMAIGAILHAAITYSAAVKILGKMSPVKFFKGIAPAAVVAFSTTSSAGTLPVTMKCTEDNLGVSKKTSSFVLPLGATINMDGTALYQGICVLFIAQLYGLELTVAQQLTVVLTATLASIGTAGVPGAGLIMLTMVLTAVNVPLEGVALIAGVDRILDMFRTAVNVIGDASAATVVDATESGLSQDTPGTTASI